MCSNVDLLSIPSTQYCSKAKDSVFGNTWYFKKTLGTRGGVENKFDKHKSHEDLDEED